MSSDQLGHFRLLGKLGAGGMGVVFRARDERLHRDVAIKVLSSDTFEDASARARLTREAQMAAALNHPNICVIHEIGEASGQTYIAMEYIEGETLADRLVRRRMTPREVIRYGAQIVDAISHAHERNVVHRDLKPGNVIVAPDNRLKVLDFGLAKELGEKHDTDGTTDAMLTQPGTVRGTVAYMAPEQLRGSSADARSDIWAMGVMLHEMASGSRPFDGKTWPELSSAILTSPPQPLPPDVPKDLAAVIGRCLAKDPADRYQRSGELRAALDTVAAALAASETAPIATGMSRGRIAVIAVAAVLGFVILGVALHRSGTSSVPAPTQRTVPAAAPVTAPGVVKTMAVIPFANLSTASDDYFVDGVHDAVIGELARFRQLRVMSRSSVLQYRNEKKSGAEIARALQVDDVVEGSIARTGDRIRVQLQLSEVKPEVRKVWSQVYERPTRDVLDLYKEVARTIARQVQVQPAVGDERAAAQPRKVDPEVYRLYLEGMFNLRKETSEGFERGLACLRQANEKDPGDPLPYAGLASAYLTRAHNPAGTADDLSLAKAAARKALELDPTLADAYVSLTLVKFFSDWDWTNLEQDFRRALEMNPTLSDTHKNFGWYLILFHRKEEAIEEMKRAREADPLSGVWSADLAWILLDCGRFDEGLAEARKAEQLAPNNPYVLYPLGALYAKKGMFREAIAAHEKMAAVDPSWRWGLGYTLALAGRHSEARKIANDLSRAPTGFDAWGLACIHAALGEKDEALRWLEVGYNRHIVWMPWIAVEPALAALHEEPRFGDLAKRLKVPIT
ncbi:MAG TPA: protein kinase [Thermoanaerobaculia bacterium]|nr:protein kinase [Thermoanaerobaculia bacterium]